MAKKLRDFTVTLYPAKRVGAFVETSMCFGQDLPKKEFQAATADQAVAEATAFATEHGKGCQASIRLVQGRKPAGFDAKTRSLYYFLDTAEAA